MTVTYEDAVPIHSCGFCSWMSGEIKLRQPGRDMAFAIAAGETCQRHNKAD